jgi:hypothetical protein
VTTVDPSSWYFDGVVAQWEGTTYEAAADVDTVRLYSAEPAEGFEEIFAGRWRREVLIDDVQGPLYVRTECRWRGEPCLALDFNGESILIEYAGGNTSTGESLGLRRIEPTVFRGWVPFDELTDVRRTVFRTS